MRTSVHLLSDVLETDRLLATYAELDTLGYDTIWTSETLGRDIFSSMTALALSTSESRIASGIVPIMHRHPVEVAMAAASIDAFGDGRLRLGLGVSHRPFVRSYGLEIRRSLTYVREFVTVLRSLLMGEEVEFEGETLTAHGAPIPIRGYDNAADIPIYLAALQPGMMRLAGELAEGAVSFVVTPEYVEKARGWIAEGAALGGRDIDDFDFVVAVPVAIDDDIEAGREACRFFMKKYLRMPFYAKLIIDQGLGTEQDCRDASDTIIDEFCAVGGPDRFTEIRDMYADAGITHVIHYPVYTRSDDYLPGIHATAPAA